MDKCFASYDFSKLKDILDIPKNKVLKLFKDSDDFCKEISRLNEEYDLGNGSNFNIFSSISKVYHYENLHSDIIKLILDPSTNGEIGNEENINLFVKLLKKIKPGLKIEWSGKIKVEREEKNIDILIYDEENAIVIENKINHAIDQYDQVGRYYKEVSKEKSVNAVVYLTLTPKKKIDIEKSIKSLKMRNKIEPLLVPVSVINPKNEELSFSDGFIKECIKHFGEEKELARVYYTQYYKLIQSLGSDSMKDPIKQQMLEEIYQDKEKFKTFKIFGDLWDSRGGIIPELVKELLESNKFKEYPETSWCMYRKIDDIVSLAYDSGNSLGFIITPECKPTEFKRKHKFLLKCFEDEGLKDIFTGKHAQANDYWVWRCVDVNKVEDIKVIVANLNTLEKALGNSS